MNQQPASLLTPRLPAPLVIRPLMLAEALAIGAWRYPAPYAVYDGHADPETLAELLDPANPYYAVLAGPDRDLWGYFCFGPPARVGGDRFAALYTPDALDVGLGLRPDLTGRGLGLDFLQTGLAFARERFAPARFRLTVAAFNRRALAVYERAGFRATRTFTVEDGAVHREFVVMLRAA